MATRSTKRAKPQRKTFKTVEKKQAARRFGILEYFRFGESYTSLLLGIVVVIISAILLVSFIKNRNIGHLPQPQISSTSIAPVTPSVSPIESQTQPTATVRATITALPTHAPTLTPTAVPTKTVAVVTTRPSATPTLARPTSTPLPTRIAMRATPTMQPIQKGKTYTVQAGDTLWSIAEKTYNSGYNWVDIAQANKITDPNQISSGTKLMLPNVPTKTVQNGTQLKPQASVTGSAITGASYTVQKGDYLWDIAVRAYGDGYKWPDIAKANNLVNPSVIHSGNVLKIPRS